MTKEIELPHNEPMTGLCVASSDEVLVAYDNNGVVKISLNGNHTKIALNQNVGDVTVLSNGHIAVIGLKDNPHSLSILDEYLQATDIHFETTDSTSPKKLDSDKSDNIFVMYSEDKVIRVFSPAGGHVPYETHTFTIETTSGSHHNMWQNCYRICE